MQFVHETYQPDDTIAAIATPPGEGGVAMIRISGKKALSVANKIYSGDVFSYASHTAHYGQIVDQENKPVDDVLILPMLSPRSYTGEDTVEIFCHGGSLMTRRVLDTILSAGARAAKPGEFTYRAFLNEKMDLAQAEAVQELIAAKGEKALDAAGQQLQGALSKKVRSFQVELTHLAAILEAWVDFPEEGIEFMSFNEICQRFDQSCSNIQSLLDTFQNGKILHDGLSLCLIGCPNVGKSSLMNALLNKDRAIVSDIPGTTRDILEDHLRLNGLNFRLLDTAGIHDSNEAIEVEGIRRSKLAMKEADLLFLVLDAKKGIKENDQALLQIAPKENTLVVWNKIDLIDHPLPSLDFPHVVSISAKLQEGLSSLFEEMDRIIWKKGPPSKEEVVITNVRHQKSLEEALERCKAVRQGLEDGVSPEFLSLDMRTALQSLGKIIGTDITEDILSSIFSTFCIGK